MIFGTDERCIDILATLIRHVLKSSILESSFTLKRKETVLYKKLGIIFEPIYMNYIEHMNYIGCPDIFILWNYIYIVNVKCQSGIYLNRFHALRILLL